MRLINTFSRITLVCLAFLFASLNFAFGQVPEAINYQAIARDASGGALVNQTIGLRITILEGSQFGPVEYTETQSVTTNQFGLFSIQVGRGTPITGTFSAVEWFDADQWLQVEMDPNGGTNYFLMGTSELLSVPYALYAERAGSVSLTLDDLIDVNAIPVLPGQVLEFNGTNWVPANDDNTTYTAGTGLALIGTTFVHAPHLGDAIGDDTLTVVGIQGIPVSPSQPQPGDVLKYDVNIGQYVPMQDSSGSTLIAGNGIAIVNDTISNTIWQEVGPNAARDSGSVGIGTLAIDPSALLELSSTEQGFLPPRMTSGQRDSITNPAVGLVIYNLQDSILQIFNGECWLATFQEDCDDCVFDISISDSAGVINRTTTDTTGTTVTVNQTTGNPSNIALFLLNNLPQGATATLSSYSIFSSGTTRLTVEADVFATPGTYPIAIQAVCGDRIKIQIFEVTIDSCYKVVITTPVQDYDLQAFNNLPTNMPICVVLEVPPGIEISASSTQVPALTTGNLDTLSRVGILNNGAILGMGGDGGSGGNLTNFGDPGDDGGDAIHLTVQTQINNANGAIYGGGGGGASVALEILSIPFIGTINFGAGGGGGAGGGIGGTSALPLFYAPGTNGTSSQAGQGGLGGILNVPITIPISPATITVTPNLVGGDGGDYGLPGDTGVVFVNIDVSISFVGSIFNANFPDPPPTFLPQAGQPGKAIRRFGNLLIGILDGYYLSNNLRGEVLN